MCIDPGGGPMEGEKGKLPGKIKLIGILTCVNSGLIILLSLLCILYIITIGTLLAYSTYGISLLLYCCLIFYFPTIVWGIFEVVMGIRLLLGKNFKKAPLYIAIIDIIFGVILILLAFLTALILALFVLPVGITIIVIGILNIVFLLNPEAKDYFGKEDMGDEYAEYLKDD